jgi:MFS family permease
MGRLADLHGRKRVFLLGVAFIGIFSLGAGFAQDEVTVDVLRAIQGIGGAALIPASLGILAHSFPPSRTRSIAFATFAAGAPMGGAIGSVIGGALTQLTKPTWRSSFFLIAGLSLAAFLGGVVSIDKDVPYENIDRRVDWLGAFLVTAALVFICFALADGPIAPAEFKTGYIIALLVLGVVLLAVFVLWQHYLERVHETPETAQAWWTPPPLMKVSVWTRSNWRMAVILCIAFFEWSSFFAWTFWAQVRIHARFYPSIVQY